MVIKKILSLLSGLWFAGCSVVGIRDTPAPDYQIVSRDREFEIRLYPPLLLAETMVTGDYQQAGSIGFKRLAAYIFGANTRQTSLAMTTPVIREAAGEEIAMTAPVLQQTEGPQWRMAFVMPDGYKLDTLPIPLDADIVLKQQPAKKIAVLIYSGSLNETAIMTGSEKLLNWLQQQSIKPLSAPRSAAYDPPWTLPMLRHNEIMVDIE